ncbi:D-alanyl-D-alanine carboxypeptidase/D-alanyl-D-alanine endopeptidase [Mucilaginibacter segetis]|uniref:D-alanyl-D-alanine carboxypeptidase/D-alanyl-D-alanine-endopeptidase n=1 Tax=Mucilaginibacter segetis TaxID=2793071 RepID=A0A934PWM3_9SPHI|nr:D-alanyl-D-alanine carboxypeptidase/D-alanyl-D-alanine-endopeptidase [Mucilaginibacter segetis]MBK0380760.1 D-alanyl-D-alanine carboxypeptidase/D-alanyl-D-alanine-endopeptidase [Mucilaginibacter segetis]
MRINRTWLISFLFIVTNAAQAQTLEQKLQTAFERLQQDDQCKYATVSLTVLDTKTGAQVFAANSELGLNPGSTMKTVTSITAFNVLGKDYQFKTQLGYTGTIAADGTLNGDIVIKGGGDPTLGSWRWESTKEAHVLFLMTDAIKKAGIKRINGSIIGDNGEISHQTIPDGWIWQDLGTYYGAAIAGLCWRENQFDIKVHTGSVGDPVTVTGTAPDMPYLKFKSELTTGAAYTGDQAYPYLPAFNSNVMRVRGTYAVDQTKNRVSASVPDPAYDAALRLSDTLKSIGIPVMELPQSSLMLGEQGKPVPQATRNLTIINSPELSKIVYWLNKKSINLYAEQLLVTLGAKLGKPADPNNAVQALKDFWEARGIDPNSMNVFDGSGLSPQDHITTLTIARILRSAKTASWFDYFYDSLPIYNNMHMKSGSINSVQAYAGYQNHDGRDLCFSIMVNNYNGSGSGIRSKMFRLLDELK